MTDAAPSPSGSDVKVQDDGSVVASGTGSGSTRADYDSWGWKEIKARIASCSTR